MLIFMSEPEKEDMVISVDLDGDGVADATIAIPLKLVTAITGSLAAVLVMCTQAFL